MASITASERDQPNQVDLYDSILTPIAEMIADDGESTANVLHVDDEPDFAEMTAIYLERFQDRFTVVTERSAQDGLERLCEGSIDCVISDYQMPRMDGIEFLEAVREDYPDLPFILCTARGSEEVASEAIAAGVTDYIQKGSDTDQFEVLAHRVQNAIEQYHTRQQLWDAMSWSHTMMEQELVGVYILRRGEFVYVNDRFAELFGYAPDDLVGRSPEVLSTTENGSTDSSAELARHPEGDDPVAFDATGRTRSGRTLNLRVHVGEVEFKADSAVLGIVKESEQLTDRTREGER